MFTRPNSLAYGTANTQNQFSLKFRFSDKQITDYGDTQVSIFNTSTTDGPLGELSNLCLEQKVAEDPPGRQPS